MSSKKYNTFNGNQQVVQQLEDDSSLTHNYMYDRERGWTTGVWKLRIDTTLKFH